MNLPFLSNLQHLSTDICHCGLWELVEVMIFIVALEKCKHHFNITTPFLRYGVLNCGFHLTFLYVVYFRGVERSEHLNVPLFCPWCRNFRCEPDSLWMRGTRPFSSISSIFIVQRPILVICH